MRGEPALRHREVFVALDRLERAEASERATGPSSSWGLLELSGLGTLAVIAALVGYYGALSLAAWPLVERVGAATARGLFAIAALLPAGVVVTRAAWRARGANGRRATARVATETARDDMVAAVDVATQASFVLRCDAGLALCDMQMSVLEADLAKAQAKADIPGVERARARLRTHQAAVLRALREVSMDGEARWVGTCPEDAFAGRQDVDPELLGVEPIPFDPRGPQ